MTTCVGRTGLGSPEGSQPCGKEATVLLCWEGGQHAMARNKVPFCAVCADTHEAIWLGYAVRDEMDAGVASGYRVWREPHG